ncbi:AMP-binding protein [Chloracidobacterium validum]|uniref:acetate--CoA ligase n=1 Tax=Chloracidobacterium validum TaxID=2821543 RepID=A0ABX8BFY6_9BACT|nr:AMP-binding protein [Chloracidobacterium validum]
MSAPMPSARSMVNPIRTQPDWQAQRAACQEDPGAFHGAIARREIHWFDPERTAWLTYDEAAARWTGYDYRTGAALSLDVSDFTPWAQAFDAADAPYYRWFAGGWTNACFNEVDRHVLAGHGDEVAFYFEGDRWDQSLDDGRGGPVVAFPVTRKQLLLETVKAALVLQDLGLRAGDRIAINLPNIMEQIYFTEAAKRLGIIYTPVFGGFSAKTLSDRIHDSGAKVVITSDGGYRNAQIVPYKEAYTDKALDDYVPVNDVLDIVRDTLELLTEKSTFGWSGEHFHDSVIEHICRAVREAIAGDITVERADAMRGVGVGLSELRMLSAKAKSMIRTAVAKALVTTPARVAAVIVVKHTGQDIVWRAERDRWAHELLDGAARRLIATAQARGLAVATEADLLALPTADLVGTLYAHSRPTPVAAEFPLFFIYTSGSTGKPKGVVHVHGGYVAGIAHTMKVAFDAQPGDVMYVIADPGWITGQSYLISAALTTRVTSVITEGAPMFPNAGRFASIIERYRVNIFKAGSTFLKAIMADPQHRADVERYDVSSLHVATFCAEPTSPAVQQFGMDLLCRQYINSYWATEHGGIVWTHFYGNDDFPLRPDAHTYPLPWIMGDVWVAEETNEQGSVVRHRPAEFEEKGEIVITQPYPYLARTVWGDTENFRVIQTTIADGLDAVSVVPTWRGDIDRYRKLYWTKWAGTLAYTQGDFARKYADGSFSLHGRSDDVINVSGHRLGTEEIEGAILRDKQMNPNSVVGNVIVIGAPHREKGQTPVAFILTTEGRKLTTDDERRLSELVRQEKGLTAVPSDYIPVTAFPETRSGKYMRRFLKSLLFNEPLGDTTTLRNPEVLDEIAAKIKAWREKTRLREESRVFETYRYVRVQYFDIVPPGDGQAAQRIALATITNPPVNALNERALDELITVIEHLERRDDVKVVIFTGEGTRSFVAGADVKQLLDFKTVAEASPLPNNAHLAFDKIERMRKPVIAAVNGVALGGGNEFQMACHYTVSEPTAVFGQPEIRLNLIPGYGGTQRLPRLLALRRETAPNGS